MSKTLVKKVGEKRILNLSKLDLFFHYSDLMLPIGFVVMGFYFLFKVEVLEDAMNKSENWYIVFLLIGLFGGMIVFLIKKRRLRFLKIEIRLDEIDFKELMLVISELEKWVIINYNKRYAVFEHRTWLTWGTRITVMRYSKYLLVNSICNLNGRWGISLINENERNIRRLKKRLFELKNAADSKV